LQLHEEVVAVLGEDGDPTYDDFDRLIYAQCVFKETLRLMPPVWALGKYCTEHTRLVDHHIAPNVTPPAPFLRFTSPSHVFHVSHRVSCGRVCVCVCVSCGRVCRAVCVCVRSCD